LSVPHKTPQGQEELRQRSRGLGQRHRTLLLLVDGHRSLGELLAMGHRAGAEAQHFHDLVGMGLVAFTPSPSGAVEAPATIVARPASTQAAPNASEMPVLQPSATFEAHPVPAEPAPGTRKTAKANRGRLLEDEDLVHQARALLVNAMGLEALLLAPVTLSRVRSARTPGELIELVWDIERRRVQVVRSPSQVQCLERARDLLGMGNTRVSEDSRLGTQWPDTEWPDTEAPAKDASPSG
jgi:hypothetical protein